MFVLIILLILDKVLIVFASVWVSVLFIFPCHNWCIAHITVCGYIALIWYPGFHAQSSRLYGHKKMESYVAYKCVCVCVCAKELSETNVADWWFMVYYLFVVCLPFLYENENKAYIKKKERNLPAIEHFYVSVTIKWLFGSIKQIQDYAFYMYIFIFMYHGTSCLLSLPCFTRLYGFIYCWNALLSVPRSQYNLFLHSASTKKGQSE